MSEKSHNAAEVSAIVKKEVDNISNATIKDALATILIFPVSHNRFWEYGKENEEFVCWTIAADNNSGVTLIYSDYGFGPITPWGLVMESFPYFGMDSNWFISLEDCFLNSNAASELNIWSVLKQGNDSPNEIIYHELSFEEAKEKRHKLLLENPSMNYLISHV